MPVGMSLSSKPVAGVVLLGGLRIVRLEPVHHLLLVELGGRVTANSYPNNGTRLLGDNTT
jgi:hypothetical protein